MTIKKQAYFFIFFVAAVHAVTFNVTVKCEPCSVTCGFANCYRVTGDGYDRQVCGKQNCISGNTNNYQISKCTRDFNFLNSCSTGYCYNTNASVCSKLVTDLFETCNTKFNYTSGCGACQGVQKNLCDKCYKHNFKQVSFEICAPFGCDSSTPTNVSIQGCSSNLDSFGVACSCCITSQDLSSTGYCTSSAAYLSSEQFNTYAKTKISQRHLLLVISLMMVLLAILI